MINAVTEIITICSENNTKPVNPLCGQNSELVNMKAGCMYTYQYQYIEEQFRYDYSLAAYIFTNKFDINGY